MIKNKKKLLRHILLHNRLTITTGVIALVSVVALLIIDAYRVLQLIVKMIDEKQDPTAMLLSLTFGYLVPLAVYGLCWWMFGGLRRAERIVHGFLFTGVYVCTAVALQMLTLNLPILSGVMSQSPEVSVWLQFWPSYVGLLVMVVVLMGYYLQANAYWEKLLYWAVIIGFGFFSLSMALLQAPTLYYNEGARLQIGNYEGVIQLVVMAVAFAWLYRNNQRNVAFIAVALLVWMTFRNLSHVLLQSVNIDAVAQAAIVALMFAAWIGYIIYTRLPTLSRKKLTSL